MGYKEAITEIEQKRQDITQVQQDIEQKRQEITDFQRQADEQHQRYKKTRYDMTPEQQLYESRRIKEIKERERLAKEDIIKLSEFEQKAKQDEEGLSEYEQKLLDYQKQGYDIEKTDDGYTFTKKTPTHTSTKTVKRKLPKEEWMALDDYRPESLKPHVSEREYEEALWSILSEGKTTAMAGDIKLKKTDEGIVYIEPVKVDYYATERIPLLGPYPKAYYVIKKNLEKIEKLLSMPNTKVTPIYPSLKRYKTSLEQALKKITDSMFTTVKVKKSTIVYQTEGKTLLEMLPSDAISVPIEPDKPQYKYELVTGGMLEPVTTITKTEEWKDYQKALYAYETATHPIVDWKNIVTGMTQQDYVVEQYQKKGVPSEFVSTISVPAEYKKIGITDKDYADWIYQRDVTKAVSSSDIDSFVIQKGVEHFHRTGGVPFFFDTKNITVPSDIRISKDEYARLLFKLEYDDDYDKEDFERDISKFPASPDFSGVSISSDLLSPAPGTVGYAKKTMSDLDVDAPSYMPTGGINIGGTTHPKYIAGTREFKLEEAKIFGIGVPADVFLSTPALHTSSVRLDDTVALKRHFVGFDEVGSPVHLEAFAPHHDFTPVDTDVFEEIERIETNISKTESSIETVETNVQALEEQREYLKTHPYRTVHYDGRVRDTSKAIEAVEGQIKHQKTILSDLESEKRKQLRQIEGYQTAHRIGYAVRVSDEGVDFERPTAEFYKHITGSEDVTIPHQLSHGDLFIKSGVSWAVSKITGEDKYYQQTQMDIKERVISAESKIAGGGISRTMSVVGSPGGVTILLAVGTFGVGKFAGVAKAALSTGKTVKTVTVGAVARAGMKASIYTGIGILTVARAQKTLETRGYSAPGEIGSQLVRTGISMVGFRMGYKSGLKSLPVKPPVVSATDTVVTTKKTSLVEQVSELKYGMWAKHPRLMGEISVYTGKAQDVGRHVGRQLFFDSKMLYGKTVSTPNPAYFKGSSFKYGFSSMVRKLEMGVRADVTAIRTDPRVIGFKSMLTKKHSTTEVILDDKHLVWKKLPDDAGKMRDLHTQVAGAKDVKVSVITLSKGKPGTLEPDVFKMEYKATLKIKDTLSSGVVKKRFVTVIGKGLGFVQKEQISFIDSYTGKTVQYIRPSGKVEVFGTTLTGADEVGRTVKIASTEVFDFKAVSQMVQKAGLVDPSKKNLAMDFISVSEAKKRGTMDVVNARGYTSYTPYHKPLTLVSETVPKTKDFVLKEKFGSIVGKELDMSKTNVFLEKATGGRFTTFAEYTTTPPVEGTGKLLVTGEMGFVGDTPFLSYQISKIKPIIEGSLIHDTVATMGGDILMQKKAAATMVAGVQTSLSAAVSVPVSISMGAPAVVTKKAVDVLPVAYVDVDRRLSYQQMAGTVSKYETTAKVKPVLGLIQSPVSGMVTDQRVSPVLDVSSDVDIDLDEASDVGYDMALDVSQAQMLRKDLKLKLGVSAKPLTVAPSIPVPVPVTPAPVKPVPPVPIRLPPDEPVFEFKKRKPVVSRVKPVSFKPTVPVGKRVLAQPFRVQRAQVLYGKATHPKSTPEIFDLGYRTGFDIPTVEEMEDDKRKKKKKKLFDKKIGFSFKRKEVFKL